MYSNIVFCTLVLSIIFIIMLIILILMSVGINMMIKGNKENTTVWEIIKHVNFFSYYI